MQVLLNVLANAINGIDQVRSSIPFYQIPQQVCVVDDSRESFCLVCAKTSEFCDSLDK